MPAANASIEAGRAFVRLFAEDSQLQRGLRGALRSVRQFAGGVQAIGRTLLSGGIFGSVLSGLSVQGFADFEDQLLAIKGILKPTEEQFRRISDEAARLGRETSFSALEIATAMAEFARAGAGAEDIVGLMGSIVAMARGSQTPLTQSAETVVAVMSQFQLSLTEAAAVADILTTAANASTTNVEELGEALKFVGPVANDMQVSIVDTAAALGLLANAGLRGTVAGTQLARVMKSLGSATNRKALNAKFGIDLAGDDVSISFIDLLKRLGDEAKNLNKYERIGLFEELFERGAVAAGLVGKQSDKFFELASAIQASQGSAAELAATMDSGVGGAIRRVLRSAEGARNAFGRALGATVMQLSTTVRGLLNTLTEWIDRNQEVAASIGVTVLKITVLGAALIGFSASLRLFNFAIEGSLKAMSLIASGVSLVVSAVAGITSALFAIPLIGPLLAAGFIAGLVAGVVKFGAPLVAAFRRLQDAAGQVFTAVIDSIENGRIDSALAILTAAFDLAWLTIKGSFLDLIAPFESTLAYMTTAFSTAMDVMRLAASLAWESVSSISAAGAGIVVSVWRWVSDAASAAFSSIAGAASSVWESILAGAQLLVDGVMLAFAALSLTWAKLTGSMESDTLASHQRIASSSGELFGHIKAGLRSVAEFWGTAWAAITNGEAWYDLQKMISQVIVYAKYAIGSISLDDFAAQMDALDTQFAVKKRDAAAGIGGAVSQLQTDIRDRQQSLSEQLANQEQRSIQAAEARRLETAKAQRELQNKLRGAFANRGREFGEDRADLDNTLKRLQDEADKLRMAQNPAIDLEKSGLKGGLHAVSLGGVNAELVFGKSDVSKRQLDVAERQLDEQRKTNQLLAKPRGGIVGR